MPTEEYPYDPRDRVDELALERRRTPPEVHVVRNAVEITHIVIRVGPSVASATPDEALLIARQIYDALEEP